MKAAELNRRFNSAPYFVGGSDSFKPGLRPIHRVASAIVCDGVSAAAVVFAPEYGNEDDHPIGSPICSRD